MNRILPLLSLPLLSLAAVFAANTPEHIGNDLKLFKDSSCTSLKPDVKDTSAFQSDAMKELADKILAGTITSRTTCMPNTGPSPHRARRGKISESAMDSANTTT